MPKTEDVSITVRPFHWDYDDKGSPQKKLEIRAWSIGRDNETYLVRIPNYYAMCVVELPTVVRNRPCKWNNESARNFYGQLSKRLNGDINRFKSSHFGYKQSMMNYCVPSGNTKAEIEEKLLKGERELYPYIHLYFQTCEAMKKAVNALKGTFRTTNGYDFKPVGTWLNEITPESKLLETIKSRHCYWIRSNAELVPEKERISTLKYEYIVDYNDIEVVPQDECKGWGTRAKILGFDIETNSDKAGVFSNAKIPSHVAYMISVICALDGATKDERKRYCILMGDCADIDDTVDGEDVPTDTEIIKVETEHDLVKQFAKIMREYDPDIVIGFNTLGFDYKYLNDRLGYQSLKWPVMGRLKNVRMACRPGPVTYSQAKGYSQINYNTLPGRIDIDLLKVIYVDHKLDEYNLNFVSQHFLKKGKHDLSAEEMFAIYGRMCDAMDKPKDSEEYISAMTEMRRTALYCVQDTELCFDLWEHLNMGVTSIEMANAVRVNIQDFYNRGQQIRCLSQLYEYTMKRGIIMDAIPEEEIPFVGGKVQDPIPGKFTNVLVIDFQSLYPSIINGYNICYTTYITPEERCRVPDYMLNEVSIEYDDDDIKKAKKKRKNDEDIESSSYSSSGSSDDDDSSTSDSEDSDKHKKPKKKTRTFSFIKEEYYKGVYPEMVEVLCNKRIEVKRLMLDPNLTKLDKLILFKKEQAIKVATNSLYGFLGVTGGLRPHKPCAVSVTAYGRQAITKVRDYLVDTYNAKIIYGDTDSLMFQMNDYIKEPKDCYVWIDRVCKEITDLFPRAIVMKPEYCVKIGSMLKKKYLMMIMDKEKGGAYKTNANGDPIIEMKGLMGVRRDNCKCAKLIYKEVSRMIMTDVPYPDIIDYVVDNVHKMLNGGFPLENFIMTKSVNAEYKQETNFMKIFVDRLTKEGSPPEPGERVSYVVIDNGEDKLGRKMMLRDTYKKLLAEGNAPDIDYVYYVQRVLMKNLDSLLNKLCKNEITYLISLDKEKLSYQRTKRCKPIYMDRFVEQLVTRHNNGKNIMRMKRRIRRYMKRYDPDIVYSLDDSSESD